MKFIGIIPARYASTRFQGKPLINIKGKSMIRRVYEQANQVLENVLVATDDERIKKEVLDFGGKVVMTSALHQSGTDRCNEAIEIFEKQTNEKFDVVINIQGDEPFIKIEQLKLIQTCFEDKKTEIATLIKEIKTQEELLDFNKPKVIINNKKEAIYFSRHPIPFIRNYSQNEWLKHYTFYKHIGLYAYKKDVLNKISKLPINTLETAESLEQLRWIANSYKIKVEITKSESWSIDTPEDLKNILKKLN